MTLESPGGGGDSAPKTGQIRLKEGFAEGGLNDDLSVGGYTGRGGKYEVAGYVPVHHGEYVIAREELRQPAIMDMARSIERERRKRNNAAKWKANPNLQSHDTRYSNQFLQSDTGGGTRFRIRDGKR
jgi:hypothetical protein